MPGTWNYHDRFCIPEDARDEDGALVAAQESDNMEVLDKAGGFMKILFEIEHKPLTVAIRKSMFCISFSWSFSRFFTIEHKLLRRPRNLVPERACLL